MALTYAIGRRGALGLAGAAALAGTARAQNPSEVKIAMLVPLSGPWARSGLLEQMGARMAIDEVNAAGGIKALGGAKLKLMEFDCGDFAEKSKDAAQRMIAQEPDLAGGFGCWNSGFTLAATEVTERADTALADPVLLRSDHRPRLQECVPNVADRRQPGGGIAADRSLTWRPRRAANGRPRRRSSAATTPPPAASSSRFAITSSRILA